MLRGWALPAPLRARGCRGGVRVCVCVCACVRVCVGVFGHGRPRPQPSALGPRPAAHQSPPPPSVILFLQVRALRLQRHLLPPLHGAHAHVRICAWPASRKPQRVGAGQRGAQHPPLPPCRAPTPTADARRPAPVPAAQVVCVAWLCHTTCQKGWGGDAHMRLPCAQRGAGTVVCGVLAPLAQSTRAGTACELKSKRHPITYRTKVLGQGCLFSA